MTEVTERVDIEVERPRISPAMWRVAGGLALAHVVVLFVGISQEKSVVLTDSPHTVARVYGSGSLGRIFTGGYVESLSFLVLLPCLVFLARAFGRRDEAARRGGGGGVPRRAGSAHERRPALGGDVVLHRPRARAGVALVAGPGQRDRRGGAPTGRSGAGQHA